MASLAEKSSQEPQVIIDYDIDNSIPVGRDVEYKFLDVNQDYDQQVFDPDLDQIEDYIVVGNQEDNCQGGFEGNGNEYDDNQDLVTLIDSRMSAMSDSVAG